MRQTRYKKHDILYTSLAVPNFSVAYSIATEYIKKWFFDKFPENYFKTVYINGKHPLDEYRQYSIDKGLKKLKPSVAINPTIEFDFDNDTLGLYQCDMDDYVRRSKLDGTFFSDHTKNLHLSTIFELLRFNYTFSIRVGTRAKQVDLYKHLMLAFKFGATQGEDVSVDCHIPYPIMMKLANDAGFEIKDDKVVDITGFMKYLNRYSYTPILYKYRPINAKEEFFVRVPNLYYHISALEKPTADDGERNGQLYTNYNIEFTVILSIPAPQFYAYHSAVFDTDTILNFAEKELKNGTDTIGLYEFRVPRIPEIDENGWNQYITTEYEPDVVNEPIIIEIEDLFKGSDLFDVIEQTKEILISPSIFMNIRIYDNGNRIAYDINWATFKITTKVPVRNKRLQIVVYADMKYIKDNVYNKKYLDERFSDKR